MQKCPHCLVTISSSINYNFLGNDVEQSWIISQQTCPACRKFIIYLGNSENHIDGRPQGVKSQTLIRPKGASRPCPPEVPSSLAEDYREACLVIEDSPKAYAALSRRCLQYLIHDYANINKRNLDEEIQEFIGQASLPSHIADAIDAIRQIDNFSAHPMKSTNTGEILPVEPHEAEWNLDVLESLFDFYFVAPAKLQKKRDALNTKLTEAGKQPMK